MFKIYTKLKYILIAATLLLILSLLALIGSQYSHYQRTKDYVYTNLIKDYSQTIHMYHSFASDISYVYYTEAFLSNQTLLKDLYDYQIGGYTTLDMASSITKQVKQTLLHLEDTPYFSKVSVHYANREAIASKYYEDFKSSQTTSTRNIYPLTYHDTFVGSIVLTQSPLQKNTYIRNIIGTNTFSIYQPLEAKNLSEQYIATPFLKNYFVHTSDYLGFEKYNTTYTNHILTLFLDAAKSDLEQNSRVIEPFVIERMIHQTSYYACYIPIEDINNTLIGYQVFFDESLPLTNNYNNFSFHIFLLTMIYLALFFILAFICHIHRKLYQYSDVDQLTKLYTRTKFYEMIPSYSYDFSRYSTNFSVIMIDLDNFKRINDTFGHTMGDYVLTTFSDLITTTLRETDVLFRWGGEEFLVLLQHTDSVEAFLVAEKLRSAVSSYNFSLPDQSRLTASFGVNDYLEETSICGMIDHADKALYISKNTGKNKSTSYNKDEISRENVTTSPSDETALTTSSLKD